jgi:hypothetical protein
MDKNNSLKDEQQVIEQWIRQAPIKADHDNLTNANLVAEIVLSNVKGELPQRAIFYESGHAMHFYTIKVVIPSVW